MKDGRKYSMLLLISVFLVLRVVQRLYYLVREHTNFPWGYSPSEEIINFLSEKTVVSEHQVIARVGSIPLKCLKIGKGTKFVVLTNGVGTDLFMWLPTLRFVLKFLPEIFESITLLVPSYRGLFQPESTLKSMHVSITIKNCVEDLQDIMKFFELSSFDSIIGWSTGAQVAMACCATYPSTCKRLFLLNPSAGFTIQSALQPCFPWPAYLRELFSNIVKSAIQAILPLISTNIWSTLRTIAYSNFFRFVLELLAFFGGFPPEQPAYFHQYMRDAFRWRSHTTGLLNLILSLDAAPLPGAEELPLQAVIVDSYFDFVTGVYLGERLAKKMKNSRRVTFSMGSHFVLLEWPELLAKEIVQFLFTDRS